MDHSRHVVVRRSDANSKRAVDVANVKLFDVLNAIYAASMSPQEKALLAYLWHRTDERTQSAWPSQKRMAEEWAVNVRSIRRWVAGLLERGFLTLELSNGRGCNRYRLNAVMILARQTADTDVRSEPSPQIADDDSDRTPMSAPSGHPCPVTADTDVRSPRTPMSAVKSIERGNEINTVKEADTGIEELLWKSLTSPELRDIVKQRKLDKLEALWREAVAMGPTTNTETNRLRFFAAAYDVTRDGKFHRPVGALTKKLTSGDWSKGSDKADDWARAAIRQLDGRDLPRVSDLEQRAHDPEAERARQIEALRAMTNRSES